MNISKEFKIGLFVLIIITLTLVVLNILRGVDILGREKIVVGRFDNVESLESSAPVHIKGFKGGHVSAIEYDPSEGNFIVSCSVRKEFSIPRDSKMVIYSTNIMGTKGVRIDLGSSDDMIGSGELIATGSSKDMLTALYDGFNPFVEKLSGLTDSLAITISSVNGVLDQTNRANIAATLEHLRQTIENADALVASVGDKSGDISSIIGNLRTMSEKLSPLVDSASESVSNVNKITKDLADAELKKTIGKLDSTVDNIDKTISEISVPLDALLNDVDSLVNAIKANPKKYMKISVF